MTQDLAGRPNADRLILLADPQDGRRRQIARGSHRHRVIEAASLAEAYPMAEEMAPSVMAMSADFLREPEFEAVVRLADLIDSRLFLYSDDGRPPVHSPLRRKRPCVPLRSGDSLDDLLARLADSRLHLDPETGGSRLPDLILIGASTGGIAAIETVLASFPADCPPTLVVQHIRDGFVSGFVQRLNARCRPRVVEATDGDRLCRGTIYLAADAERHLVIAGQALPRCSLVAAPPRNGHRPAVDPLFESALPRARGVAAALLTGMGSDGAVGLGALRQAGAQTIAQDRATSVVWGMPRAAVEQGAAAQVLPIDRIGAALLSGAPASALRPAGEARG